MPEGSVEAKSSLEAIPTYKTVTDQDSGFTIRPGRGPIRWDGVVGQAPAPIPSEVPNSVYTDPLRYEQELAVMRRSWLLVCHSSEVKNPGDVFLAEQLGQSVLVVRQRDGSVAAWHNVCQHRGTRLVCESLKNVKRFTCPYHHWVYGLDGFLVGVPGAEAFRPDQLQGLRTPPVYVEESFGWVWINLSADKPVPLAEWLGELNEEFEPYRMEDATLLGPYIDVEMPANWKRAMEAFIELYHISYLHGKSVAKGTLLLDQASYALFERNSMFLAPLATHFEALQRTHNHQGNTLTNYTIYPISAINNLPMQYQGYTFTPLAIDRTRMRLWLLYPPGQNTPERRAGLKMEQKYVSDVFSEDIFICSEQRHTATDSGNKKSLFGKYECRIAHLHHGLNQDIDKGSIL